MSKDNNKNILITRPMLPNIEIYENHLHDIWNSRWLTNFGSKHKTLEELLKNELQTKYCLLFNNGTTALSVAIKSLGLPIGSEIITTAFTFAATPHCISWNGYKPVFCDIDQNTMTIDVNKIESLINDKTSAILGVHVYGFPCNVEKINNIAKKYNLKVIYDAAHAFSTEINNTGIGNYGDITMFSFHATKLFNTIEGGCLTFNDASLLTTIEKFRNFGITSEEDVESVGINGKLNELQAAIGIENLKLYRKEQEKRSKIKAFYDNKLSKVSGITIPKMPQNTTNSYQYYPIIIEENYPISRDTLYEILQTKNIFTRKYFYPACIDYQCYKNIVNLQKTDFTVVNNLKNKVLCLPFYGTLSEDDLLLICEEIKNV